MGYEDYRPDLRGNFADVHVGQFENGDCYIRKVLGKKQGGYTLDQARRGIFLMTRFIDIAKQIDLPLGKTYDLSLGSNDLGNNHTIIHTQEFVGRDVEQILKHDFDPTNPLLGYFMCFHKTASNNFTIALDVHTANFCVDSNGNVKYIDLMPPRQTLDNGVRVATFPEDTASADAFFLDRIFTLEGQVPDIYAKVIRALAHNPQFYNPETTKLIQSLLKQVFGEVIVENMLDKLDRFARHPTVNLGNINHIRTLAVEIFFNGRITIDQLEHIFTLTHFSPMGNQPDLNAVQEAIKCLSLQ